jgi:putative peptidoglycan lipid II flippase
MAYSQTENYRVTRAAGIVGAATLVSRVLGLVRDVLVAYFIGAGFYSDAFFTAFRIPNLLRRLFAEGSLTVSFVPVFVEYLAAGNRRAALDMARSAFRLLALVLMAATVIGILCAPLLVRLIAPGFVDVPGKFALTVTLTRIVFPYIIFIGLVALSMGVLNGVGHFAAPALAPALLNVGIIACLVAFSARFSSPVFALAGGVLVGGALQLALQVPVLMKNGVSLWRRAPLYHPGLKTVAVRMLPAMLGAAVYQINIVIGNLLASLLPEGSISYLYYADRLVQFPLGLFGIATATAVLPSLSKQAARGQNEQLADTFAYAMKLVSFITLPAMAGLIVLRRPIIMLIFERGAFDLESVRLTASALLYYSIGLWAFSAVRIVVSVFYALQDTATPVKMAVISIGFNLAAAVVLMRPMGHGGLALATSLASMVNLALLTVCLQKKLQLSLGKGWLPFCVKAALCSLVMAAGVSAMAHAMLSGRSPHFGVLLAGVAAMIVCGVVFYVMTFYLAFRKDLRSMVSFRRQGRGE